MITLKRMFVIFFALLSLSSAHADFDSPQTCPEAVHEPTADLRSGFPPLRDQDGLGWCYAFGGVDQLAYWAVQHQIPGISLKDGKYPSASSAALTWGDRDRPAAFNAIEGRKAANDVIRKNVAEIDQKIKRLAARMTGLSADQLEGLSKQIRELNEQKETALKAMLPAYSEPSGGHADTLLNDLLQNGFCLENEVSSMDQDGELGAPALQALFEGSLPDYFSDPTQENLCKTITGFQELFPQMNPDDIVNALSRYPAVDPIHALNSSCTKTQIPEAKRPEVKYVDANFDDIAKLLDSKIPVGISYNDRIYTFGNLRTIVGVDSPHYSVIVGKRFNCATGKREFLIRNSWGKGACEQRRGNFLQDRRRDLPPEVQAELTSIDGREDKCVDSCSGTVQDHHECVGQCFAKSRSERIEAQHPPFECEDGYFVMEEEQLTHGVVFGYALE